MPWRKPASYAPRAGAPIVLVLGSRERRSYRTAVIALPARFARVALACAACCVSLGLVRAQPVPAPSLGASSPRVLVERFLELTDDGDYAGASRLVDRAGRSQDETERTVRRLRVVLDRYGPVDIDSYSASPDGDLDDKPPESRERIAQAQPEVPGSLRIVRTETSAGNRWLIARSTLARVDAWYRVLPSRWLVERLPRAFARPGPFGVQPWQWLAILGALVVGALGALACGWLTRRVFRALAHRTKTKWDDHAILKLRGPFVAAWFLFFLRVMLPLAAIAEKPFELAKQGLRGALAATLFWATIAAVEAARVSIAHDTDERAGRRALLGLGGRLLKMVLMLAAVIVVMAELGFSVTSLLAGIGVGGLGLALAAQKTVENVFGAFSLGVDQPFREGDTILADGVTGTVESIGLRSTRIRTLDRTVVAIPNGKLAEMRTETLSARDRYRLLSTLSLSHGTSPSAIQQIIAEAEALLRTHEKAGIDARARLVGISVTSIEVEVSCSFLTTNAEEFGLIRQEMLLALLAIVERAEVRLSTASILRREPAPASAPAPTGATESPRR